MNKRVRRKRDLRKRRAIPGGVKRESMKAEAIRQQRRFKSVFATVSLSNLVPGHDALRYEDAVADQGFEWPSAAPETWEPDAPELPSDPNEFIRFSLFEIERSRFYTEEARAEVLNWAERNDISVEEFLPDPIAWEDDQAGVRCTLGHNDRAFMGGLWRCRTCHNTYAQRYRAEQRNAAVCVRCGRVRQLSKGRCHACAEYLRRRGEERPLIRDGRRLRRCAKGHLNWAMTSGKRYCRTCRTEWQRAHRGGGRLQANANRMTRRKVA